MVILNVNFLLGRVFSIHCAGTCIEKERLPKYKCTSVYQTEGEPQMDLHTHGYNGSEPTRICPHCGKEKPLSEFGFRKMESGEIRNQSWCKDCR